MWQSCTSRLRAGGKEIITAKCEALANSGQILAVCKTGIRQLQVAALTAKIKISPKRK